MVTPPHVTVITYINRVDATTRQAVASLLGQLDERWQHHVVVARQAADAWAGIEARYSDRYRGRLTVHTVERAASLAEALAPVQIKTPYAALLTPDFTWHPAF